MVSEMPQLMEKTEEKKSHVPEEEEEEKDDSSELQELQEMKKMADEADGELSSELDSDKESPKERETAVESNKELEVQLAEKSSNLAKLTEELSALKRSESQSHTRLEELEKKYQISKESEEKTRDLLAAQTKQLEQTKISLEESKLEIQSLKKQLEKGSSNSRYHHRSPSDNISTKQELADSLKYELEATKHKLGKSLLHEARREADLYKSTVERLRLEAEESLLAWSGRETSLVDCIRSVEDDRFTAQQENRRLMDVLRLAELKNMTSKEEIKKLRDILKQALNEATVAKEAAGIAIEENSQLKDCLSEKENALDFVSSENETLKVSQATAQEEIKELKRQLEEASKKEEKNSKEESKKQEESKEQGENTKWKPPMSPSPSPGPNPNPSPSPSPSPAEKEDTFGKRLGKAFSFSFLELRFTPEKKKEVEEEEEEEEPEMEETLKGSIFDVDSPVSATAKTHQRKRSAQFVEDGEMANYESEDMDQLEEDLDGDRNSRKKKALIRRFGDLLMRKRSLPLKKEQSPE